MVQVMAASSRGRYSCNHVQLITEPSCAQSLPEQHIPSKKSVRALSVVGTIRMSLTRHAARDSANHGGRNW
jgi:hypothetical protein